MTEDNQPEDRDETVRMAGVLETRFRDMQAREDELEAMNESLRVGYDAVSAENVGLRKALDLRTRQRDAATRELDLYKSTVQKVYHQAAEALRATTPRSEAQQQIDRGGGGPIKSPDNL